MHSILTFQMETNRTGCIDRDINGCLNMKKIFKYYLKTGKIPQRYKRGYDINTFPTVLDNRKVIKRPSSHNFVVAYWSGCLRNPCQMETSPLNRIVWICY